MAPMITSQNDDPIQPLRAMADRVGREVEKFAERVDHWHSHGNDHKGAKYETTLRLVGKFRDVAEATVKDLRKQSDTENQGELDKSVRRRIQSMAEAPDQKGTGAIDRSTSLQPSAPSVESESPQIAELRQWQAELATWELLRIVIENYHPSPATDVAAEKRARLAKVGGGYRYSPNHEIWNRFLLEDEAAKEKDVVLRWLEQTARNSENDIQSITRQLEAESGMDTDTWTSGWLDTRSKIKHEKRLRALDRPIRPDDIAAQSLENTNGTSKLVTQLDPDAPVRQQRSLEKSDEYYERALWMVCYEMIRRGAPWEEISDWCRERSEGWRSISLGAAHDFPPSGGPNVSGPTVGFLFRRMCLYAAAGANRLYEEAVYGLLGGGFKLVQPVCRSWDDHLYARYNALLLSRFDNYLQTNHPRRVPSTLARKFVFQDAAVHVGDWEASTNLVIDQLKQDKMTSKQALSPIKLIQGSLISRNVDDLLFDVGLAILSMLQGDDRPTNLILSPDSSTSDPRPLTINGQPLPVIGQHFQSLATDVHGLRILVHVFIILWKGLDLYKDASHARRTAADNVVCAYIEFLRITKRFQLIPLYAAQLDQDRRVHCLSRILPDISNAQEQKRFLNLVDEYHIGVVPVIAQNFWLVLHSSGFAERNERIAKLALLDPTNADQYLWPGKRIASEFSGLEIGEDENALIASLRWFIHVGKEMKHTFMSLADSLRLFLLHGRLGAAAKLIDELSVEKLSLIKTEAYCGYAFDFTMPGAEDQDTSEITYSPQRSTGRASIRPSEIPSAREHTQRVEDLRRASQTYYELQQIVRVILLFQDWRGEEDRLIKQKSDPNSKIDLKHIKDLYENITQTVDALLESFLTHSANGTLLSKLPASRPANADAYSGRMFDEREHFNIIRQTYIPEILIGYLSIIQAASFFTSRDLAIKAMDLVNVVADNDNVWIQDALVESNRMTEFMDVLAEVSKAMLVLGEMDKKKTKTAKRGSRGETIRIWDLNSRN